MKRIPYCVVLIMVFSACCAFAADDDSGYGTNIAIEVRQNGQLNGVGKLEYTGKIGSIDIVTFGFVGAPAMIDVLPQVYIVLEKSVTAKGVHYIKCQNQYGAIASGTIDFRDYIKPQVTLVGQGGHVFTNISEEGEKLKMKYIPNIYLGH